MDSIGQLLGGIGGGLLGSGIGGGLGGAYQLGNYNIGLGVGGPGVSGGALTPYSGTSSVTLNQAGSLLEPYVRGPSGLSHAHRFMGVNPDTGRVTWFIPAGRPILFSGDLAAVRRVRRIAGRLRRRVGGR